MAIGQVISALSTSYTQSECKLPLVCVPPKVQVGSSHLMPAYDTQWSKSDRYQDKPIKVPANHQESLYLLFHTIIYETTFFRQMGEKFLKL